MEGMMMEQMNFGGAGMVDFQGDLSGMNWMDGLSLMNVLQNDLTQENSPRSPFLSNGHRSPTDSSINESSLSSLESGSSTTSSHSSMTSGSVFNDGWFDGCGNFAGAFQSPGFGKSPGGFGRSPGIELYPSLNQGFAEQRKPGPRQERSQNPVSGSVTTCVTQATNVDMSMATFAGDSCVPANGVSAYGDGTMSSMSSSNDYMKPATEYQVRQSSSHLQQAQVQQRHQVSSNSWNGHPQQRQFQQQQHQQHQQQVHQQQHQPTFQQQLQQNLEPEAEDPGLRLVHLLIGCADAIQRGDLLSGETAVMKINQALAMAPQQQAGPMSRVASHFAEALTKRIYGVSPNSQEAILTAAGMKPDALSEILHFQFYETCPYLKFAHFTANQAILEAFKGAKHVHVIDFNLNHGLQWPALIQALALRPGGPPILRLTGIGPAAELGKGDDPLKDVGMSLAQLAESVKVKFEFRGVAAKKLDDIKPWDLQVRPGEVVAVNSMMQLHKLLYSDSSNPAGIDKVLRTIRSLNPKIVAMSEQEANHNSPNFLDRFMKALHFYSSMFDSLEASKVPSGSSAQMLAEMYLGREICNIVACEGAERLERHETLNQWRIRLRNAGFEQIHMGPNAFKQASMLLTLFSGQGYRVEDNQGCLTLCWHDTPLIAASAWHCA